MNPLFSVVKGFFLNIKTCHNTKLSVVIRTEIYTIIIIIITYRDSFQILESIVYQSHCERTVVECLHVVIWRNTKKFPEMYTNQPFSVQI